MTADMLMADFAPPPDTPLLPPPPAEPSPYQRLCFAALDVFELTAHDMSNTHLVHVLALEASVAGMNGRVYPIHLEIYDDEFAIGYSQAAQTLAYLVMPKVKR
jgi:hypothetical protein